MANETRLRINFAAVLARCFGEDVAEKWITHKQDEDEVV